MKEEIKDILTEAKRLGLICKGKTTPLWQEPGMMYILKCELCTIKALKNPKGWSIIKQ
jgi:hypothetical protein|tara:strand:+ start:371 stop:544 length:174 start_codon:yes stop_codon:yes gene_type:complete